MLPIKFEYLTLNFLISKTPKAFSCFSIMERIVANLFANASVIKWRKWRKCKQTLHYCSNALRALMMTGVSLVSQARPNQPQRGSLSVSCTGKGLVMLDRFLCATSQLARVQSDWLRSHAFELILMCETAESEDRSGEFANVYITPT